MLLRNGILTHPVRSPGRHRPRLRPCRRHAAPTGPHKISQRNHQSLVHFSHAILRKADFKRKMLSHDETLQQTAALRLHVRFGQHRKCLFSANVSRLVTNTHKRPGETVSAQVRAARQPSCTTFSPMRRGKQSPPGSDIQIPKCRTGGFYSDNSPLESAPSCPLATVHRLAMQVTRSYIWAPFVGIGDTPGHTKM